jgi:glutamate dehydrogenase (NAD(P)+)
MRPGQYTDDSLDIHQEPGAHLPEFEVTIRDEAIGLTGYVVIDSAVDGHACGGLRYSPDATLEKIRDLAHGMTLKYGFSGMRPGGAKAGIVADPSEPPETKRSRLRRFGELAAPLLRSRYYISGPDMGTSDEDIRVMLEAAGISIPRQRRRKGKKSGFFAALGVMVTLEACAEHLDKDLSRCSIAIQGFGSVGCALAQLLNVRHGTKVVAISTVDGALLDPKGLDIDSLFTLFSKSGSRIIDMYPDGQKIPPEDLFLMDVDLLSPCANQYAINLDNAAQIRAPIVCPGANNPVTKSAEKVLFERGILSVPYFVANCGGVIGNMIEMLDLSDEEVETVLRAKNKERVLQLLRASQCQGRPMTDIAEEYALRRIRAMQQNGREKGLAKHARKLAVRALNAGLLPSAILRPFRSGYLKKAVLSDPPIQRNDQDGQSV